MKYDFFHNEDKERQAREAVALKGRPASSKANDDPLLFAPSKAYLLAKEEDPKLEGEELVIKIYLKLGGKLEELSSKEDLEAKKVSRKKAVRQ